jgi:hypothetical protein
VITLPQSATIDPVIQKKLDAYPVDIRPKRWNGKAKSVTHFKLEVLKHGLTIQSGKCAWCQLAVGEEGRRTPHRDHIAPKAKHAKWTFLPQNIVISCEYCNGFAIKGEIDTISVLADDYERCTFHVVHPYIDDATIHVRFVPDATNAPIIIQSLSDKGAWTIQKLKLDTPSMTLERAKSHLYERYAAQLNPADRALFTEAIALS